MRIPIWDGMKAKTRMTLIIVAGCVLIAAMLTGNFDKIMGVLSG